MVCCTVPTQGLLMNYIFLQIVITPHISGNNSCQKESRTNISIFNSRIYTTYFLLHRYLSFKKFTFRILSHNKFCELAREILSLIHSCKCTKLTNRKAYIRKRSFYCLLGKDKSGTLASLPALLLHQVRSSFPHILLSLSPRTPSPSSEPL